MNNSTVIFRNYEDMTACLKITDRIKATLDKKSWHKRLTQTVAAKWSTERKFEVFFELADEVNAVTKPLSACTKLGCSHCCHIACEISDIEAAIIGKAIKRKPVPQPPMTLEGVNEKKARRDTFRAPCTFLKDGKCSIYEHRPIACRIMHNIGTGAGCDLSIPSHLSNVPTFDFRPLTNAMALVSMQGGHTFGDIRDFFPA